MDVLTETPTADEGVNSTPVADGVDEGDAGTSANPPIIEINATSPHTRVAKLLIDQLKAVPKAWAQMTFAEQNVLIGQALTFGRDLVDELDRKLAQAGRVTIAGTLVDYQHAEKKFVAKLDLEMTKNMAGDLFEARGQEVLVVVAGVDRFAGPGDNLQPDVPKDNQPDMFGGGGGQPEEAADPRFVVVTVTDGANASKFELRDTDDDKLLWLFTDEAVASAARNFLADRFAGQEATAGASSVSDALREALEAVTKEIIADGGADVSDVALPVLGSGRPSKEALERAEEVGAAYFRAGRGLLDGHPQGWPPSMIDAYRRGWSAEQGKPGASA
ncbi:hypothetical protein [Azospirillum brasilense]|uniref:Uncharacterized protein n=1 Tax=Azospirillum brasilense TaxID=192 RepID=A0A235H9T4_AZOBR|nr:hypothetical protein [Azospirillum brasilense]OYD82518.1 hypothetical protein CHT98_20175 [Azospirillum brasilense]